MFKKLKRKFILTNLLTSTVVLFIAFVAIYSIAAGAASRRVDKPFERPLQSFNSQENPSQQNNSEQLDTQPNIKQPPEDQAALISDFNQEMFARIEAERQASLQSLLISLVIIGISVEIIVAIISFYLAEQSIKPVRDAYQAQKDFVANASHEIKTPLAVIQANLEAADIQNNRWLDNVAKKAEDLANLNNQLLALARSEAIEDGVKVSDTNLNKIVTETISAFTPKAKAKGIDLTQFSEIKNGEKVKLNRQAFEQILNIYTDNGIKYGKKQVTFVLKKSKILVKSDGKLIDQSKLTHLFDRFYQTDKSSEGVGLGLAIAKSIAEKNGWKVSAAISESDKTNVFILEFK